MRTSTAIEHLIQTRENIIKVLVKNEEIQHNKKGKYNNTLFWNAAHCLVTLELLVYGLSGNKMTIDQKIIDRYRKGTSSDGDNLLDTEELVVALRAGAERLKSDYESGKLNGEYKAYETSYGITLNSIEEAISFNNLHEALHFGYMMAQARA